MEILQIAGMALTLCMLAQLFRKDQPSWAFLIALAGCLWIAWRCLDLFFGLLPQLHIVQSQMENNSTEEVIKCLFIALVSQISQALCKDAEQNALAVMVDFGGRVLILACAAPILQEVLFEALQLLR